MLCEDILKLTVTEVYSANTIFTTANTKGKRNGREHASIGLKYSGETEYLCNGKRYPSNINSIVFLSKGSEYSWRCVNEGYYCFIEFDTDFVSDTIYAFETNEGDRIKKMIRSLENGRLSRMERIRTVYDILLTVLSRQGQPKAPQIKQRKIQNALIHIESKYFLNTSNDELAALCGISTVYFRKLFTEVMGQSPIEYLHKIRTEKAKELLRSDYGSLSNVAQSVGYPNVYHFSKMFKKITGITPGSYSKAEL